MLAAMPTVLIIDDNAAVAMALEVLFSLHDIAALRAVSPEEGLDLLGREPVDLVIQDMNFTADTTSGEEGVTLFREIRQRHPDLPVILLTAWTHLDAAVDLVQLGAADYLSKPWNDERLLATVGNLIALGQAIANLVDNALKYGSGLVTIRVEPGPVLIVADDGPGIPPERREEALKRFGRLDAARTESGAGLGLSLASAVAHLHGGTLILEDHAPGLMVRMTLGGQG